MRAINYKHLQYFWAIAKRGGLMRASEYLNVSPQSISGQIKVFEEAMGTVLFRKAGRGLELTDSGRMAFEYAERIFNTGSELQEALQTKPNEWLQPFRVGVSTAVGRSIAYRVLRPVLLLKQAPRLNCLEGKLTDLLADLSVHKVDVVISDRPMDTSFNIRGFNHLLGECGVTFLAAPPLAKQLKKNFPRSLDGAPMLMHGGGCALRMRLNRWLEQNQIKPKIVAEFDDTALLKAFAQEGVGAFIAPSLVAEEVAEQYNLTAFGSSEDIIDQSYMISTERRLTHPAVVAMSKAARNITYA